MYKGDLYLCTWICRWPVVMKLTSLFGEYFRIRCRWNLCHLRVAMVSLYSEMWNQHQVDFLAINFGYLILFMDSFYKCFWNTNFVPYIHHSVPRLSSGSEVFNCIVYLHNNIIYCIYTMSQKTFHSTFIRNFCKCCPIFRIHALSYSPWNLK